MQTLTEAQFTAQDEAALREMFDVCPGYVMAGDWVSWARMYAEDGFLQPPHAPTVRGRPNLLAWGQAFPEVENLAFSKVEIWGEGNVAFGTSTYTLKAKDLPTDAGKQLVVFRRIASGQWAIMGASFSSDLPVS
jgi:ketosteroid isomerase-like protein